MSQRGRGSDFYIKISQRGRGLDFYIKICQRGRGLDFVQTKPAKGIIK